mmetsp:Transcript_44946/g.143991  ORF Transcript_44946/g.143991 Transcript_44946/m.143991 type:complete len:378 (+) Transcript_44946:1389-2522(+)
MQGLVVIVRERAWIQPSVDSQSRPKQLHGHAHAVAGSGAHGAKDGKNLEALRRVDHDVLCQLDLPRSCLALEHHHASNFEGAARWRLRMGLIRGLARGLDNLLVHVHALCEASAQHLRDTADSKPSFHTAELLHVALHGVESVAPCTHLGARERVVVPREAHQSILAQAYRVRRFLLDGLEDADSPLLALDLDRRQRVEDNLVATSVLRVFVAQDAVLVGVGHQPCRQVYAISEHRVLHSAVTSANTAIASSCRDAEAPHELESLEHLHHVEARQHRTRGVVGVDKRRQAKDQQKQHALIVDHEFVQGTLVLVALLLHLDHQLLCCGSALCRHNIQSGTVDEDDRDVTHLVDVNQRSALNLLEHSRRDVLSDDVELG